jgi:uncharacterized protein
MTPQEEEMIRGLIDRVQKTQLPEKDFAAEQLLEEGLGRNPDSLYILAQTVLVQKYALEQAQAQLTEANSQLEQVRQQAPQGQHSGSFLGNLLHWNDAPGSPQPPPPPQQQGYATVPPQYAQAAPPPPPPYGQPVGYGPGYGPGYGAPQGGGFLQNAMQTAAGVAAGALAFEGIESLMHGFGHAAGYGGAGLGGFGGSEVGERPEVINNYYDDRGGEHSGGVSGAEREEGGREDHFGHQGDDQGLQSGSADDSSYRDSFVDTGNGGLDNSDSGDSDSASLDDSSFSDDGSSDGDFGGGGDDSSYS